MNLKELSQLDIKDLQKIDFNKVLASLMARPDALIATVCVAGAVMLSFTFFGQRHKELTDLQTKIQQVEQKTAKIEEYKKAKEDLQSLIDSMPEGITEEELVNRITDLAGRHRIQIESYAPAQKEVQSLYETTGIMLKISAKSYEDVWNFVREIEQGDVAVRVDGWHGNIFTGSKSGSGQDAAEGILIQVNMEITAVTFKDA